MKHLLVCLILGFLLWTTALADVPVPFSIEGRIGDYAMESRTYVVGKAVYTFPVDVVIQDNNGRLLSFKDLTGGKLIKIYAEKTINPDNEEMIEFIKIIVLK